MTIPVMKQNPFSSLFKYEQIEEAPISKPAAAGEKFEIGKVYPNPDGSEWVYLGTDGYKPVWVTKEGYEKAVGVCYLLLKGLLNEINPNSLFL